MPQQAKRSFHWIFQIYLALVCFASGVSGVCAVGTVLYGGLDYTFPFLNEQQYRIDNMVNPHCAKAVEGQDKKCPEPKTVEEAKAIEHKTVREQAVRSMIKTSVWLLLSWVIFFAHWRLFRRVNLEG